MIHEVANVKGQCFLTPEESVRYTLLLIATSVSVLEQYQVAP